MLKEYETIFVLDPGQDESQVEAEITKISDIIKNGGGEIVTVNRWGRRKLAYEIRKKKEGIYTLIQFQAGSGVLADLGRRYNLLKNETILRHMTVLYEAPPEVPVVPQEEGSAETVGVRDSD